MKILIVPEIASRESSFVRPGEIQVVGYKEHLEDISRLLDAQDKLLAYDESKERELFEVWYKSYVSCGWSVSKAGTWESWQACAKSRARSAE